MKQICVTDFTHFADRPENPFLPITGHSVLTQTIIKCNGDKWRRMRRAINAWMSTNNRKAMAEKIGVHISILANILDEHARLGDKFSMRNILDGFMSSMYIDCIMSKRTNFPGHGSSGLVADIMGAVEVSPIMASMSVLLPKCLHKYFVWLTSGGKNDRFVKAMNIIIDERLEQPQQTNSDMLSIMLNYLNENGKSILIYP